MDTQTLTQKMQGLITADYEWTLNFFNSKKSRDGVEFEFGKCNMKGIGVLAEKIRITLLERTLADRTVAEYTPFLTKESIGVLPANHELICESVSDMRLGMKNAETPHPEDYISGVYAWPSGYVIQGIKKDGEDKILYVRRTNPFINPDKNRIYTTDGMDIVPDGKPVLKFLPTVDLLIVDDNCYMISNNMDKDLNLESRHYAICAKRMALIAKKGIINDYDRLESVAMNTKNVRKFLDFDKEILEYIERLSITDREEFLLTYGITLDKEGRMDTYDSEQCDLIVDLLCCRSCLDPLGRLAVANGISPRE